MPAVTTTAKRTKHKAPDIPVPEWARPFTNVQFQVAKLPPWIFEQWEWTDGKNTRKVKALAANLFTLLVRLARYADPDGTNIYPSKETLMKDIGWSDGKVKRYLRMLVEMGFLLNGGYVWESGPRNRRLVLPEWVLDDDGKAVLDKPWWE